MVIISLSDREVIDHLRGDALIEEVPGDTEQKKPFQPKVQLPQPWVLQSFPSGPSPKGGGSQYIFLIGDKEPAFFKVQGTQSSVN